MISGVSRLMVDNTSESTTAGDSTTSVDTGDPWGLSGVNWLVVDNISESTMAGDSTTSRSTTSVDIGDNRGPSGETGS